MGTAGGRGAPIGIAGIAFADAGLATAAAGGGNFGGAGLLATGGLTLDARLAAAGGAGGTGRLAVRGEYAITVTSIQACSHNNARARALNIA